MRTNDNSQYSNRTSISPFWSQTCPTPLAAFCSGQSSQDLKWLSGCQKWLWRKVQAWEDPNWQRTPFGPGLSSFGGLKTGCLQNAPLLPGPWVWCPWTRPETFADAFQLGGPKGHLELECWEGSPLASPWQGSLGDPQTQTKMFEGL